MKSLFLTFLLCIFLLQISYSQNTFPATGNVAINTSNPQASLEISSNSYSTGNQLILSGAEPTRYYGTIQTIITAGSTIFSLGVKSNYTNYFQTLNITNGNVGIGTTSMPAKFNVYQSVGLGSTPQNTSLLSTVSGLSGTGNNFQNNIWLVRNAAGSDWYTTRLHDGISIDGSFLSPQVNTRTWWERDPANNIQSWGTANSTYLSINNGNVLIGKTTQINTAYILDVAGNVRANQIVVNANGADFVFASSYRLPTLSFLKKYINQNHHLPEIPSAKQMKADGLNVGDNQVKLLQKVEELTLYTIASDKTIKEEKAVISQQQTLLSQQQNQLKTQQEEIDQLKQQVQLLIKNANRN